MGYLKIEQKLVTKETAEKMVEICPFGAMTYTNNKLDISAACKMCKICIKKSDGLIEYVEEVKKVLDKSLWSGICVYVDHCGDKIHHVTYELCGKAKELSEVLKDLPCHVNLIKLNEVDGRDLKAPSTESCKKFLDTLNRFGVSATMRRTLGDDIEGACGQLRNRVGEQNG